MNTTPAQDTDYKHAVNSLRNALKRSRWDAGIAARPGAKIHYIFDTNVFLFHANLEDESTQMDDFASLLGVARNDAFVRAIERLTADQMFNGGLVGQGADPIYISSSHFDEVISKTYDIDRALSTQLPPSTYGIAGRIRRLILEDDRPRDQRLLELQKIIPTAWLESLRSRAHFSTVLTAAFLAPQPRLVPLHHVPWGWDAGRPAEEDVKSWRRSLGEVPPGRDRNLASDALTLATIVELYRNNRLSRFDNRKHLYLFVTTSRSISAAVSREISHLKSEGIPYFVRSPKDFIPLLSIGSVVGISEDAKRKHQKDLDRFTEKLKGALDWTEFNSRPSDTNNPLNSERKIEALQETWRDLSGIATLFNATYFEKSNSELFEGLTDFVSSAYDEGIISLTAKINHVRMTHVGAVLDNALASLKYSASRSSASLARRAQLKLVGSEIFGDLIEDGRDIVQFIDDVIAQGTLDSEVERAIRSDPANPRSAILVACLFLAAEDWKAAAEFANQAVAHIDPRTSATLYAEASYLSALCIRFSMVSDQDFVKATRQLDRNLYFYRMSSHAENHWRRIRDQIERSSLFMSSAVMQAIASNDDGVKSDAFPQFLPRGHEREYFDIGIMESERALDDLLSAFEDHLESKVSRFYDLANGLYVQVVTNLAGAWVFGKALPKFKSIPSISRARILALLNDIIAQAESDGKTLRGTQYVFSSILMALESNEPEDQVKHMGIAREKLAALQKDQLSMSVNDRVRFDFLSGWLSGRLAASAY